MSDNDWLDRFEAAEFMQVHPSTIRRWYDEEGLPGTLKGNTLLFRRGDLKRFKRPAVGGYRGRKAASKK